MDYNHIKNFLEKFKKLIYQKEELKEIIYNVITEEIKHSFDKSLINIKNGIILISGSPMLRSEILIHKKQILLILKNKISNNNFIDIR